MKKIKTQMNEASVDRYLAGIQDLTLYLPLRCAPQDGL
jgi:hypothetical protein